MKVHKIKVKTKDSIYPILIGNGAINYLKQQIKFTCPKTKKVALILDKKIPSKQKKIIKKQIRSYSVYTKEYSTSENLKSFSYANSLAEALLEKNFNRNDTVIAAGGGIIGDFVGFWWCRTSIGPISVTIWS